jgi:glycine cleavage system H protein
MSEIPSDLKFTSTHEWIEDEGDGTVRVGITDHAQALLGDMVYVELPEIGRAVDSGEECAVVESVKAASDVYSPVAGEIVEVNELLGEGPDLVNKDPFGEGWLFRVQLAEGEDLSGLLDADGYAEAIAAEESA